MTSIADGHFACTRSRVANFDARAALASPSSFLVCTLRRGPTASPGRGRRSSRRKSLRLGKSGFIGQLELDRQCT